MSNPVDTVVLFFQVLFASDQDTPEKLFFVRRRAEIHAKQNPSWTADKLSRRIQSEIDKVEDYLGKRIGKGDALGPLITGKGDKSPAHLDLEKISETMGMGGRITIDLGAKITLLVFGDLIRKTLVIRIVWRALAIHQELWKVSFDNAKIQVLDEIVDRRLRVVERMIFHVNSGELNKRKRKWQVSGARGSWEDGQPLRMFEYPWLPKKPFVPFIDIMAEDGWQVTGNDLTYDANGVYFRVAAAVISEFVAFTNTESGYIFPKLKPNKYTPAETLEKMLMPSSDFWDRNWFYCDQVAAAIAVEALQFALKRRETNDNTFNAGMKKDYVYLTGLLSRHGERDIGVLMADSADPFFENIEINMDDLQVGDEVIFWNHPIYQVMAPAGAWRNEYSYIIHVENDVTSGHILLDELAIAGHGINVTNYGGMASELVDRLREGFVSAQTKIVSELAQNPQKRELIYKGEVWAVKWAPYGEAFDPPGAWWLVFPKAVWDGIWGFSSASEAALGVPLTVIKDPQPGTGYVPPPIDDKTILFPLYEPAFGVKNIFATGVQVSWNAYLEFRRSSNMAALPKLSPIKVDGRLAPGLCYRGKKFKVPVIRPKIRQ